MAYQKLGRDSSARKALFRDLVTDLFINERIETTEAKAKAVRSIAEKLITKAKRGDLHSRREVASYVRKELVDATDAESKDAVQKLFDVIGPRYANRAGGYTRIYKTGPRRGDGAPMAILELIND